ncbi:hypothetical protein [Dyella mobilis]|uniref:Uncharacterized protein n=1 Tax=Dyella mobilis TaxID=1849582 RepID=A0ABS2KK06_9GAMM|nr:hypothetical protein [Dyella mobilis]MBM7131269.1 hypothetical protein [Dyella mobilis]GLQ98795.1 hypothetical protein GCM10007863_32150 [Dyella mobilis]
MLKAQVGHQGELIYVWSYNGFTQAGTIHYYDVKRDKWIVTVLGVELEVDIYPDGSVRSQAKHGETGIWFPMDDGPKIGIEEGVARFKALAFNYLALGVGHGKITLDHT